MSGGHFQYPYHYVNQFTEQLEDDIRNNKKKDGYGYCYDFKPETVRELKRILKWCKIAAQLMRHAEWLYSSDDSEEDFAKNIKKIK